MQDATGPVRVIQVGAGGMGRAWLRLLSSTPDVELVGVVDLNLETARAALDDLGIHDVPVAGSLTELAAVVDAQAVVNVTIPAAHHPVNVEAHLLGLPILCEKPVAPTIAQALSLAAVSEATGQLLMVSQSRRYFRALAQYRRHASRLGEIGALTCDFFKAPHFGGFREEMPHVLLVDMAIHAFDAARYVLDQDPVSVYCEEYNPGWSWYAGNASATAVFEMSGGARFSYTGSWCADGLETSWNGSWRVNGANGTALWDGTSVPVAEFVQGLAFDDGLPSSADDDSPEEIAGALAEFVSALRTGETPSGEVHSNILSLAMVEAAVRSAESGQRVLIADVLNAAYEQALSSEQLPAAKAALEGGLGELISMTPAAGR
ncbi:Gfo/Idh/MocA family protein [Arthrobacter sp. M4]|uniref:Gfo/Idh/MocA family protein n=1 Tax=Arthrobacter sp. M4 TaxID=218160 RepID=UPI001CDD5590|nr:Gfo/Idh/MocA family oxidoreductase [Arthrobacter sp. M4]MCA4131742.1 Gfo/Idh/MocA family oxidoreductase [Arthrobacter sp. M4]